MRYEFDEAGTWIDVELPEYGDPTIVSARFHAPAWPEDRRQDVTETSAPNVWRVLEHHIAEL